MPPLAKENVARPPEPAATTVMGTSQIELSNFILKILVPDVIGFPIARSSIAFTPGVLKIPVALKPKPFIESVAIM